MMKTGRVTVLLAALLLETAAATAQKAVFVVRHGEKISNDDERLTEAGKARGERLAKLLGDADIAAIYSTDTERTLGTARPLAGARSLEVKIYDKTASLAEKIREENTRHAVLVVGHSNTVPELLKALGCSEPVSIAADEYDNLFIVVPTGNGPAALLRLRY